MKPRDDKGLTLGSRTMLRLYLEFTRTERAMNRTGDRPEGMGDVVRNPNVVAAIGDLLVVASEMGKKIGTEREVAAYLLEHEEEDNQWFNDNAPDEPEPPFVTHIKEMLMSGAPCPKCGEPTCRACKECHQCDKPKEQVN